MIGFLWTSYLLILLRKLKSKQNIKQYIILAVTTSTTKHNTPYVRLIVADSLVVSRDDRCAQCTVREPSGSDRSWPAVRGQVGDPVRDSPGTDVRPGRTLLWTLWRASSVNAEMIMQNAEMAMQNAECRKRSEEM